MKFWFQVCIITILSCLNSSTRYFVRTAARSCSSEPCARLARVNCVEIGLTNKVDPSDSSKCTPWSVSSLYSSGLVHYTHVWQCLPSQGFCAFYTHVQSTQPSCIAAVEQMQRLFQTPLERILAQQWTSVHAMDTRTSVSSIGYS